MTCSQQSNSGCRVQVWKDYGGGPSMNVKAGQTQACRNWALGLVGGPSRYAVYDCPETVVPLGHYRGQAGQTPMSSASNAILSIPLKGVQNLGQTNHQGWNDNMWGISFHTVPNPDNNQIKYDYAVNGVYKPGFAGIGIGPKDNTADQDDVRLTSSRNDWSNTRTGRPCPGGKGWFFQGGQKVRCIYNKTDDAALRTLFTNKNGVTNDPRATMHAKLKDDFCAISDNIFKNPGGGICLDHGEGKRIAKEYCKVGDRIVKDGNCIVDNLGNTFYSDLAEAYCKTTAGKADPWCSCYNVTNGVCDTDSAAAGCDIKRQQFDKLVEATPEGFRNVWSGKEACFGGVCQGNKYVPQNANQNCNAPVQICAQSFDLSQISESTIEAQCNLTATTGTPPSAGDSPSGTPSGTPTPSPSGTPTPSPSGTPTPSPPESGIDINNNTTRLAIGGGALLLVCCCLLIIIVLMSSGGGGGGSSRFRR